MNFLITPFLGQRNISGLNSKNNSQRYNRFASSNNLGYLDKDTVSFTGGKARVVANAVNQSKTKVMEEWDPNGRNFQEIIDLCADFEKPVEKFLVTLRRTFKDLVASPAKPDNPIMPGATGIKGGVKNPHEVAIKANSRKLFDIEQIAQMGDVGRARIVLRSSSQSDVAKVFSGLSNMVKQGWKIKEVENYRPSPNESYVAQRTLNKFEEVCNKYGQYPEIKNKALPNGYTAIHVTFETPDGKLLELQIMGIDMENSKVIQDFYYKQYCNKKLSVEYQPIQDMFDRVLPTLDPFQQETLARYQKDSFDHARVIPANPIKHKVKVENTFLPFPYSLPQELSYANLYKMKCDCDKIAKAHKK